MRKQTYILLFAMLFIATACPPSNNYNNEIIKFQNNNNNFPDLIKETFDGITFSLSSMFNDDFNTEYVIQDNAMTRVVYEMSVYFTVESFSKRDVEVIKFAFENDMEDIEAVHKYYIYKRTESIGKPFVSEQETLSKSLNLNGFIQVIEGSSYDYNEPLDYFIASFKVDDKIYVMQMIGKSQNMNYLHDDFLKILRSVH